MGGGQPRRLAAHLAVDVVQVGRLQRSIGSTAQHAQQGEHHFFIRMCRTTRAQHLALGGAAAAAAQAQEQPLKLGTGEPAPSCGRETRRLSLPPTPYLGRALSRHGRPLQAGNGTGRQRGTSSAARQPAQSHRCKPAQAQTLPHKLPPNSLDSR